MSGFFMLLETQQFNAENEYGWNTDDAESFPPGPFEPNIETHEQSESSTQEQEPDYSLSAQLEKDTAAEIESGLLSIEEILQEAGLATLENIEVRNAFSVVAEFNASSGDMYHTTTGENKVSARECILQTGDPQLIADFESRIYDLLTAGRSISREGTGGTEEIIVYQLVGSEVFCGSVSITQKEAAAFSYEDNNDVELKNSIEPQVTHDKLDDFHSPLIISLDDAFKKNMRGNETEAGTRAYNETGDGFNLVNFFDELTDLRQSENANEHARGNPIPTIHRTEKIAFVPEANIHAEPAEQKDAKFQSANPKTDRHTRIRIPAKLKIDFSAPQVPLQEIFQVPEFSHQTLEQESHDPLNSSNGTEFASPVQENANKPLTDTPTIPTEHPGYQGAQTSQKMETISADADTEHANTSAFIRINIENTIQDLAKNSNTALSGKQLAKPVSQIKPPESNRAPREFNTKMRSPKPSSSGKIIRPGFYKKPVPPPMAKPTPRKATFRAQTLQPPARNAESPIFTEQHPYPTEQEKTDKPISITNEAVRHPITASQIPVREPIAIESSMTAAASLIEPPQTHPTAPGAQEGQMTAALHEPTQSHASFGPLSKLAELPQSETIILQMESSIPAKTEQIVTPEPNTLAIPITQSNAGNSQVKQPMAAQMKSALKSQRIQAAAAPYTAAAANAILRNASDQKQASPPREKIIHTGPAQHEKIASQAAPATEPTYGNASSNTRIPLAPRQVIHFRNPILKPTRFHASMTAQNKAKMRTFESQTITRGNTGTQYSDDRQDEKDTSSQTNTIQRAA